MAKRKKPAKPMDVHTKLMLHARLTVERDAMIGRCTTLRDQGKLEEARRLFERIEAMNEDLKKIER